jgi:hypothetical protein
MKRMIVIALFLFVVSVPAYTEPSAQPPRTTGTRTEHDLLGAKDVPADAYHGVHDDVVLARF